jgi:GntR family transcriptional regulator
MRPVNRSPDAPLALHDQVAAQIRRAIAEGEAQLGDRLPPSGDLAAVLKVNRNTVLRALRLLRDEGLVEFRRGRGVTVIASPLAGELTALAGELVRLARHDGYRLEELLEAVRRAWGPSAVARHAG